VRRPALPRGHPADLRRAADRGVPALAWTPDGRRPYPFRFAKSFMNRASSSTHSSSTAL
jgi:hypothetical protein